MKALDDLYTNMAVSQHFRYATSEYMRIYANICDILKKLFSTLIRNTLFKLKKSDIYYVKHCLIQRSCYIHNEINHFDSSLSWNKGRRRWSLDRIKWKTSQDGLDRRQRCGLWELGTRQKRRPLCQSKTQLPVRMGTRWLLQKCKIHMPHWWVNYWCNHSHFHWKHKLYRSILVLTTIGLWREQYPANKISSGTRVILESRLVIPRRICKRLANVSRTFHFQVKLGKYTSLLNMSLGMFTILENLPCLSCVYNLCFSLEIHKILTCAILKICLACHLWSLPLTTIRSECLKI